MKHPFLICLSTAFFLASCGGNQPFSSASTSVSEGSSSPSTSVVSSEESESAVISSKPGESEEESLQISSEESLDSDISEASIISSDENLSSEVSSDAEESSEETLTSQEEISSIEESSEEIEISIEESSSEEALFIGDWSIDCNSVEPKTNNTYPAPYTKEIETSGGLPVHLDFEDVMVGQGKYQDPYIQMKKISGEISSQESMQGTLVVSLYANMVSYGGGTEQDMTGYPTIYSRSSIGEEADPISYVPVLGEGIFTIEIEIGGYLDIVANDTYAAYFSKIEFTAQ